MIHLFSSFFNQSKVSSVTHRWTNQAVSIFTAGHTAFELGTPLENLHSSYYLIPKRYLQYFNVFKAFVFFFKSAILYGRKNHKLENIHFYLTRNYSTITSATALCQAGKYWADSTLQLAVEVHTRSSSVILQSVWKQCTQTMLPSHQQTFQLIPSGTTLHSLCQKAQY